MSSTADPVPGSTPAPGRLEQLWVAFALTWAAAVLFHLAGNTRLGPWWSRAAIGVAAVAVLAGPRRRAPAGALAVAVLVQVWLEAPLLSNHSLLHGAVAAVVLGGLATRPAGGGELVQRVGGPLRLLLLAFYAFAAFAKLNGDFFDPSVSCARHFLEQSADSWGLGDAARAIGSGGHRAVAVLVASVELAVPALLLVRRSRSIGVLVALSFHFVLALDRSHQFFDFSSVLASLFLLFLPVEGVVAVGERVSRLRRSVADRWPSAPELVRLTVLASCGLVVVVAAGPGDWPAPDVLRSVGVVIWVGYGAATIAIAAIAVRSAPSARRPLLPASANRVLLVVPLLAALNGLTPYLELKTGASWNMYANLSVVDGTSNHLLVRSGIPLTDAHERLVEVVEADGVDLGFYDDSPWRLPEVMLLDHLADRPGATVVGTVDGEEVRYVGGRGGGRPTWQRKLQVFRAVDVDGPVSCQPSFGPAR